MPMVLHPRIRKAVCRVSALTALGVFASTGLAAAACPVPATTTPFSALGDTSSYFLVPGGSFEASGTSWSLDSAQLTAGGPTAADSESVTINSGGSATSPAFCLDATMPAIRFYVKEAQVGSDLNVSLVVPVQDDAGWSPQIVLPVGTVQDGSAMSWTAPALPLLTRFLGYGSVDAQLRFSVPTSTGRWQLDDVYVDPYRS